MRPGRTFALSDLGKGQMTVEAWHFPGDLRGTFEPEGLVPQQVDEALACAWEYLRTIVPAYTNRERYIALARLTAVSTVAEFRGEHIDPLVSPVIAGYDTGELLEALFGGTAVHEVMAREYYSSILVTAEKSRPQGNAELLRRYTAAIAHSPAQWFRIRDCDAQARLFIAAALACNDIDGAWLTEEQNQLLTEICDAMYDAIAYHKHRAEGEICNTFAYANPDLRQHTYRTYRDTLWKIDAHWADIPERTPVVNFLRNIAGPIHMTMRRYRFVEDGLAIGNGESAQTIEEARRNVKLWYRFSASPQGNSRFREILANQDRVLFPGFAAILENTELSCRDCRYPSRYTPLPTEFAGVHVCAAHRDAFDTHLAGLPGRAVQTLSLPCR
ncbi:hypothetical protein ACQEWB_48825 [Streptomyces sp. CA-249302]|uniref:hypothetical protein n=1 Tax=Streptomyces sp. CA-249302 TaxID=3240058 RepID=UPI003D90CC4F